RIVTARRYGPLHFGDLKKMGVVLKRAQYFITCSGRRVEGLNIKPDGILRSLIAQERPGLPQPQMEQFSLFV
ncbi:MAG: hypothetical protein PHT34_05960, partial [Oscillospiraceae bacterium]|nr:hypothetical protein [Oscillospiraceae bacterium]